MSEAKGPEIIARKKGVAAPVVYDSYPGSIGWSDRQFAEGYRLGSVGEVAATGLAATKFGFYVPAGQQLLMANFSGRSF